METINNLNIHCFYRFARMNNIAQEQILQHHAHLIDTDLLKDTVINVYYLKGFFVEETRSADKNEVLDIVPFKRGYRINNLSIHLN
jgi:hypothetical protein